MKLLAKSIWYENSLPCAAYPDEKERSTIAKNVRYAPHNHKVTGRKKLTLRSDLEREATESSTWHKHSLCVSSQAQVRNGKLPYKKEVSARYEFKGTRNATHVPVLWVHWKHALELLENRCVAHLALFLALQHMLIASAIHLVSMTSQARRHTSSDQSRTNWCSVLLSLERWRMGLCSGVFGFTTGRFTLGPDSSCACTMRSRKS